LKRIFYVIPTYFEYAPLRKILNPNEISKKPLITEIIGKKYTFIIYLAGIGKKNMKKAVSYIKDEYQGQYIVSGGCCGGLKPYLKPGSVLMPEKVKAGHHEAIELDQFMEEISDHVLRDGDVFSVNRPADVYRKQQIRDNNPQSFMIDMESYWLVKYAKELGMQAAVLRVLVDTVDDEVPEIKGRSLLRLFHIRSWLFKRKAKQGMKKIARIIKLIIDVT